MRKSLLVLLSVVLGATIVAGCGVNEGARQSAAGDVKAEGNTPQNFNGEGYPIVNEAITLKMMGVKGRLHGPWEEMAFFQEMEQKTNIRFAFDTPPGSGYDEKKNLAFASGEYPDVFFGGNLTASDEVVYGKQGILIPLEGLIEAHAPNIKKFLQENPNIQRSITTPDGHIYALPLVMGELRGRVPKIFVNGNWLEQLDDRTIPATTEELYEMLKAFKEQDMNKNGKADEIPLSANAIDALRKVVLSYFGHASSPIELKNDKAIFVPTEEGYKQYLAFMNRLYSEKLLDNEIFSHTREQFAAKGKANQIGMFMHALPMLVLDIKTPEDNAKHPVLPPLTSPSSQEKLYPLDPEIVRGTFAITNKNKYPEAMVRWVDYLYTEEGSRLAYMGKEGTHWIWEDEQKTKWKVNESIIPAGMNSEEFRGGKVTPDAGAKLPIIKSKAFDAMRDDVANRYAEQESEKLLPLAKEGYPLVYFTEEEQKQLDALSADLNTYVNQMEAKFITGQESLDKWDGYVATIQKMGADDVVSIHQAAYERWKSEK
jgi:putative aldouronate transport system substrate-binding protein